MTRLILSTLAFTFLFPGTIAVLVPRLLLPRPVRLAAVPAAAFGGVLIAAGIAIYVRCAWDFVRAGRGTPAPYDPPRLLVVRGLYRWTRNPIYVGVTLVLLGEAALFGSWALLAYAAAVLGGFHLRVVLYEEPVLRKQFGAAYDDYCRRVPRWAPPTFRRRAAP